MPTLHPFTQALLVLFFILATLILLLLFVALAYLLFRLNGILERYESKIGTVLDRADTTLKLVNEKTESIGGKAETLLLHSNEVVETVHGRVDRTADVIQRTINTPIIGANSFAAAVKRGWATFSLLQSGNGARSGVRPSPEPAARVEETAGDGVTTEETVTVVPASVITEADPLDIATEVPAEVSAEVPVEVRIERRPQNLPVGATLVNREDMPPVQKPLSESELQTDSANPPASRAQNSPEQENQENTVLTGRNS
ncbi:MAG: hypothetical protein OHK0029_42740 [Armatimonadaceae bacterium]